MARKDLPYLPLYVQDFLTDEKLMECTASATGVYIRIMCVLHKCNPYGKYLLRQKDKQNENQINNFALKLAKHLPYRLPEILDGLNELIDEDVLQIDGDYLIQKRMVNDGILSANRSLSGRKGGLETQSLAKANAKAKTEANTENEIDINSIYSKVKNSENGKSKNYQQFRSSASQGADLYAERIKRGQQAKAERDGQQNIDSEV